MATIPLGTVEILLRYLTEFFLVDSPSTCSIGNGGCTHKCTMSKVGAICSCPIGFELNSTDRKSCVGQSELTIVLNSFVNLVFLLSFDKWSTVLIFVNYGNRRFHVSENAQKNSTLAQLYFGIID